MDGISSPSPHQPPPNPIQNSSWIQQLYPIHLCVWNNDLDGLKIALKNHKDQLESRDAKGKTPLLLAVCLDHFECAKYLLENGAKCDVRHDLGWSAVHEATCSGDVELLSLVLQYRDAEKLRYLRRLDQELLGQLSRVPDFYVEMRWEFTSWIPFVAKLCPSDVCRIYKKGANVRLDTTLIGLEGVTWQRGAQSFLFVEDAHHPGRMSFHEVDHTTQVIRTEKSQLSAEDVSLGAEIFTIPSEEVLRQRMRTPVMLTTLDSEKIQFDRTKTGLFWRSDKEECIDGHVCKVSSASNVAFVTTSRSEHMTDSDKERLRKQIANNPFNGLLSTKTPPVADPAEPSPAADVEPATSCQMSVEDYFGGGHVGGQQVGGGHVGRPRQQSHRSKVFKANLWMCDDYPLSLSQQILPIIDMMAQTNAHFAKVRDFISLHLPSGFPLKIEIPLFHVLTAKITFENICATSTPVELVTCRKEMEGGDGGLSCDIEDAVFQLPEGYERQDASWRDELAAMLADERDGDLSE